MCVCWLFWELVDFCYRLRFFFAGCSTLLLDCYHTRTWSMYLILLSVDSRKKGKQNNNSMRKLTRQTSGFFFSHNIEQYWRILLQICVMCACYVCTYEYTTYTICFFFSRSFVHLSSLESRFEFRAYAYHYFACTEYSIRHNILYETNCRLHLHYIHTNTNTTVYIIKCVCVWFFFVYVCASISI